MQYTLRNIPEHLDRAVRERAHREHKSINEVAVAALAEALGLSEEPIRHRDLGDLAGSWLADPQVEQALSVQRRIDEDLWS